MVSNHEGERLKKMFAELADEELLRRCASGTLTELAQSIAMAEVRARGLSLPAPKPPPSPEPDYQGDWVIVAQYLSFAEVHILRSLLQNAGIPAEVADAQLVQTDALLIPALRGARLRVPATRVAEAQEVLAAFKRGDFELGEDFEPR
jgi:hypothetical protein